ncbi:MAG: hypothetical protein ACP5XB_31135 [Isosphaeraceae bacterium]
MRPLRNLGIVVLSLLAASGCAEMQSRVAWPSRANDEQHQSRLASWFKSRSRLRSAQDSPSTGSAGTTTPEVETAGRTMPETEIWPEERTARLPRLFSWFGHRNPDGNALSARSNGTPISMMSRPTGYDEKWVDSQVKPVAGDQSPSLATTTSDEGSASGKNKNGSASTAFSGVAPQPSVKPYAPPQPEGDVALDVAPAGLSEGLPAGLAQNDTAVATNRRVEDPLVTAAGDTGTTDTTDTTASQTPSRKRPSPPPPPIEPKPAQTQAKPALSPAQGTPSPSPKPRTMPQPGSPPSSPTTLPPQSFAPAPMPVPSVTKPAAPTPTTPPVSPSPSRPVAEPLPTAEPGPKPTAEPVPAPATINQEQTTATPASQGQIPWLAPTAQAGAPSGQIESRPTPSPQMTHGLYPETAGRAKKQCFLKTWWNDLHARRQAIVPCCQLPPPTFPTSYVSCLPTPQSSSPPRSYTVTATPQTAPCATCASGKSCFNGPHKCVLTEFFNKIKSKFCSCACQSSPMTCPYQTCSPCGWSSGSGKCGGTTCHWASPQAMPSRQAWTGWTGPSAQASLGTEAGDVAQGSQVLDRIAAKGLGESPQR